MSLDPSILLLWNSARHNDYRACHSYGSVPSKNGPLYVILTSRIVYAMNWYNLSPALSGIQSAYSVTLARAGLVFSFFLLGAGFFQVVSGIIAARVGSKTNCVAGLIIMSAAGFLGVLAPDFYIFLALRFLGGVGAAFFFSSAVAVLNDVYPERLSALTGYYVAAFDLGAGAVVIGFTPLTILFGLAGNEIVLAFLTLLMAALFFAFVPKGERYTKVDVGVIYRKLKDGRFWFLAIAFSGIWSGNYLFSEYLKSYASLQGASQMYAGAIGSSILFFGFFGSFLSSRIHSSKYLRSTVLMVVILGISLIWVPFLGFPGMWLSSFIVGIFTTTVLAIIYTMVVTMDKDKRYVALNSGLFNSIQIMLGFSITVVFTVVLAHGFTIAWIFMGIFAVSTLPFLIPFRISARKFSSEG